MTKNTSPKGLGKRIRMAGGEVDTLKTTFNGEEYEMSIAFASDKAADLFLKQEPVLRSDRGVINGRLTVFVSYAYPLFCVLRMKGE